MDKLSEIEELIKGITNICPDILVFQKINFGEKPFESSVWRFENKDTEEIYIHIEVQNGMLWALYASEEFEDKYPITAIKICKFLKGE